MGFVGFFFKKEPRIATELEAVPVISL